MMKVGILFPNSETSRFLAIKLLETGYDVVYFCPNTLDLDRANNMIYECNMIGMEQDSLRGSEKSFSVEGFDVSDCNVIGWISCYCDDLDNICYFSNSLAGHSGQKG